jgi:dihydroflavonol-4-reductase
LKALVTGGTGFVGSHIVRALREAGHSVRVLHRTSSRLDALAGLAYESAIGDILDRESLRRACAGCDWVFHAAAVADYWRADQQQMFTANVDGTRFVVDAANEAGVRRVVFTSSAAAVGIRADGQPADETVAFNLPPERFPYGYSKVQAEEVVRQSGQDVVIVNPVIVMGPGDLNLISGSFIMQVKRFGWLITVTSGGVAVTDVRDVARWHVAAAEKGRMGERYLLGTDNYSHREWLHMIGEVIGAPRPRLYIPDPLLAPVARLIEVVRSLGISTPVDSNQVRLGAQRIYFDFNKAWTELGRPTIDMRQSVQDTYDWYMKHGYIK